MTTDPAPDLTDTQKAYNVAQSDMFQLAAYGHHRYHPSGEALTDEGKRQQRDYNTRIQEAREELEAAVLRLVAERAETFRGDWGVVAAWLRSLADDPAEVSLLAVRPDEREAPPVPVGRDALRDRIAEAIREAACSGDCGKTEEQCSTERIQPLVWHHARLAVVEGTPEQIADAVLAVLPPPADRAAVLREAADRLETHALLASPAVKDVIDADVAELRRMVDEPQQPLCDAEFEGGGHCAKPAGHRPSGSDDPHVPSRAAVEEPATETEAHPPTHTWNIESPRREEWASWGANYDEREWAAARYEEVIGVAPQRPFRLVRATTTYTVEAEHTPKEA